ncbi:MAG: hypothetical protein U0610_01565 [bacterium]
MRAAKQVCALVVMMLAAGVVDVWAGFYVSGVPPAAWGAADATLGLPGGTVEDFEDATLAPGLQVEWLSSSGNVLPTATLPALFDPAADSFGSAFVGGTWDGTRALISSVGNASHEYTQSQFWGDVGLRFDPPVAAVGFSVQQLDNDATLWVNGQNLGALAALSYLTVNGARIGYVRVVGTGGSTIESILLDNAGGDGFVVDHLVMLAPAAMPDVTVAGVAAGQWAAADCALGLPGARRVEDFEDVDLISGLTVAWTSPAGDAGPATTLPATFDPVDDTFGVAFLDGTWDGTHGLLNTRDNASHTYADSGNWGDVELGFAPPVAAAGFSVAQLDQEADLLVNGVLVGGLSALSGLPTASGHVGYLRFDTSGPETLASIRVENRGFTPGAFSGDGVLFDHVVIAGGLLSDGFECGDTSAWSARVPP